jgi:hypothetical protein
MWTPTLLVCGTPSFLMIPISVKSCTGYVITFANCPIFWSSKLQTEVALSTTEAEYIVMSQAARDLIPMKDLLSEFSSTTKLIVDNIITHSTIFENNKGCIELANAPKLRPRTNILVSNTTTSVLMSLLVPFVSSGFTQNTDWQIISQNLYLFLILNIFISCFLVGNLVISGSVSVPTYEIPSVTTTANAPEYL